MRAYRTIQEQPASRSVCTGMKDQFWGERAMTRERKSRAVMLGLLAGAAGLSLGCAGMTEPVRVANDFGRSVEQMKSAQTYDPVAAATPATEGPTGAEGRKLEQVLEVHRSDVGRPAEIKNEIQINVGN
jgi:hypothetical protein